MKSLAVQHGLLIIHAGRALPPHVKEGAIRVRDTLEEILQGAAVGEL